MSTPPSATTKIILDRMEELREDQRDDHKEVIKRLDLLEHNQREQGGQLVNLCQHQEACMRWNDRHEKDHGLRDAKPSPWIANATSWAWHHPKRTLVCLVLTIGLFAPPVRYELVKRAGEFIKVWW